jgi:ribosome assembly protein YihI (activator of Der GTPase)
MNEKLQIEELIRNGGFRLRRDFRSYMLDDREISAEEFDELLNRLLIYLDNCEEIDKYDYSVGEEKWHTVGLYRCPGIGKVGVVMLGTEGVDVITVYSGEGAWRSAKNDAIDDIQSTIEFLESIENTDELLNYLNDALDEVTHMPE